MRGDLVLRLALRALSARPLRTAVLACGFGFGIAVMASLLGVGEVVIEQARSPALRGGGDVVVTGNAGTLSNARFLLASVLGAPPLAGLVAASSPSQRGPVYLVRKDGSTAAVRARGGVPSLERAVGDPEVTQVAAWRDVPGDLRWTRPEPAELLREMDRFHAVPDVPARRESWAEWLYFNGHTPGGTEFYLTFLVGAPGAGGRRPAGVRLQVHHGGSTRSFSGGAAVPEAELLAAAPDLSFGPSTVRLDGLAYRIHLELRAEEGAGEPLRGDLVLHAVPGRSVPPFSIEGMGGWVSGYTVPVLSGRVEGTLKTGADAVSLDGEGYHDHNWGFWRDVSWEWGQVAYEGLSILYGRVRPPPDAADPERVPGFLAVMGAEGPLGFARDVRISRTVGAGGTPERIEVQSQGGAVELKLEIAVQSAIRTTMGGPLAQSRPLDFLQMRGTYDVSGHVGARRLAFRAPGAAETFLPPAAPR